MCFQRKCILIFSQGEYVLQTWFCTRSAPRAAEGHLVQKSSWFRVTSHEAETSGIAPLATGILLKQICVSWSVLLAVRYSQGECETSDPRAQVDERHTPEKNRVGVAAEPRHSPGKPLQSTSKNSMVTSQCATLRRRT